MRSRNMPPTQHPVTARKLRATVGPRTDRASHPSVTNGNPPVYRENELGVVEAGRPVTVGDLAGREGGVKQGSIRI